MPKRIQRKRTKGWRMPKGAVYVGRPTKWANPFRVGGYFMLGDPGGAKGFMGMIWCEAFHGYEDERFTRIADRAMAVEWYRRLTAKHPPPRLNELRGKDLACWCPLTDEQGNPAPCHADVLLELANGEAAHA